MLKKLRKEIDLLDQKIIELIDKRLTLALETRKYKNYIEDHIREEEIVLNIKSLKLTTISEDFAISIISEILSESKRLQKSLKANDYDK